MLEELKADLAAATQGIWEQNGHCVTAPNTDTQSRDDYVEVVIADCQDDPKSEAQAEADARLIVRMKAALPALIAAAETMKEIAGANYSTQAADLIDAARVACEAGESVKWQKRS